MKKKKKQQNVFCLICDVSRNSMLALCNFTEEKFRNRKKKKKKNHTGSVFLSSYYLGTWVKCVASRMPVLRWQNGAQGKATHPKLIVFHLIVVVAGVGFVDDAPPRTRCVLLAAVTVLSTGLWFFTSLRSHLGKEHSVWLSGLRSLLYVCWLRESIYSFICAWVIAKAASLGLP